MSSVFDQPFGAAATVAGQPIPIKAVVGEPMPFPIGCLPPKLQAAVNAVMVKTQVPDAVAAQSVLGAAALAAQCRINIKLPTDEVVPSSLYLFTVASSGDRKTSADKLALRPVYEREKHLRVIHQGEHQAFLADNQAYKAATAAATKGGGKDRDRIRELVEACGAPPTAPPLPMLLADEGTVEGILKLLDQAYPSLGLFSDEGAQMLGSYSMQEERKASTGGTLSQIWDGKPIKRVRGTDVTTFLVGRRMSVHLMVQPGIALKLFADKALRDQGMMSRILVAFPKTRKGERFWQETEEATEEALRAYWSRLERLLQTEMRYTDEATRELLLDDVELTPEARTLYIQFNDHIERQIRPGGKLDEISDFASKLAQHAMRLAAVVAYFENGPRLIEMGISAKALGSGIELAQFYAGEALRLYNAGSVDEDSENASALIEFIIKRGMRQVGLRWLSQQAPRHVRPAKVLRRAVDVLVEMGHLVPIRDGAHITVNDKTTFYKEAFTVIVGEAE